MRSRKILFILLWGDEASKLPRERKSYPIKFDLYVSDIRRFAATMKELNMFREEKPRFIPEWAEYLYAFRRK